MLKEILNGESVVVLTLTGEECGVTFTDGYNTFEVDNRTDSEVTISLNSGAVSGDDGCMVIPAGEKFTYKHMRNARTVYLNGKGAVALVAANDTNSSFSREKKGGDDVSLITLEVTENGEYTSKSGFAYSKVNVDVPDPELEDITITENGTYTSEKYGFGEVKVEVDSADINTTKLYVDMCVELEDDTMGDSDWEWEDGILTMTVDHYNEVTFGDDTSEYIDGFNKVKISHAVRDIMGITPRSYVVDHYKYPDEDYDVNDRDALYSTPFGSVTMAGDVANLSPFSCNTVVAGKVKSIELPPSLTRINSAAFYGCTRLKTVTMQDLVTRIDNEAFYGCVELNEISLSSALLQIGDYAFMSCVMLEEIELPASLTLLGTGVFRDCVQLKKVVFNSIPSCSYYAASSDNIFYNCVNLEDVVLYSGWSQSINLSFSECLTHDSMVAMFNALADLTGSDAQTITLGVANLDNLSDDEIAIATAKNWTVA